MFRSLIQGFNRSVDQFPDRPALVVDQRSLSYRQLKNRVHQIAGAIRQCEQDESSLLAVFGSGTETLYAALLAALAAGKGYVPLNPKFPAERTRTMLQLSGARTLVADRNAARQLGTILTNFGNSLTVILPDEEDVCELAAAFPQHQFISARLLPPKSDFPDTPIDPEGVAYLLFTSGSTGQPKGVAISQRNVRAYVDYAASRYEVTEQDRFSQEFELTFDLSVHDMFVCWERGACLYCVPQAQRMFPAKFIREHQLTMWFSVPSLASNLMKARALPPGCFPTLRYSLFCGEPLSAACAAAWQQAAPQSILENLYGPTETTIAISHYRWHPATSAAECLNGIAPIGWMFDGQQARVVGSDGNAVPIGESGELCLGGSQVARGYWNDPQKTERQFVRLPGEESRTWYRTGDLVKQDERGCLFYLGRIDQQVKVRGYRVELQEVDLALRRICGTEQAVAVPWPVRDGAADGLVGFVCGMDGFDELRILRACREMLPEYMVPQKVWPIDEIPLNQNGKTDRKALAQSLEGRIA